MLIGLFSCSNSPIKPTKEPVKVVSKGPVKASKLKLGKAITLWSTGYFSPWIKSNPNEKYCLQDVNGKCISGMIRHDQMCFMQMQGSGKIDGKFFTFVTANDARKPARTCYEYGSKKKRTNVWSSSHKVKFRWNKTTKFGRGSFSNELVPFVSIACPKQYANNTKFYIEEAEGLKLPNGKTHDGIFSCHDRGGAIKGNHIDTFIGLLDMRENWKMNDWARATRFNPFKHVKSKSSGTFKARMVVK